MNSSASIRVLGIMTGTSSDGMDLSQLRLRGQDSWEAEWNASHRFPARLRKEILELQRPGTRTTLKDVVRINKDLGVWYAETALHEIESRRKQTAAPDLIANHGQTVFHSSQNELGATLQLGDPSYLAARTGITVASNFREGDMAAGGEGAPLAPFFHRALLRQLGEVGTSILNLGGMGNLTYLKPGGELIAFDTGPANAWIDAATEKVSLGKEKMDRGGKRARRGTPDEKAAAQILKIAYFSKAPPKSTGRDDFPFSLLARQTRSRGDNLVATATEVSAQTVVLGYRKFIIKKGLPLKRVLVCGGGAKNPFFLKRLSHHLPGVSFEPISAVGVSPEFIEAQAFALLGFCSLLGQSLGGEWTGAAAWAPPARILPGKNWKTLLKTLNQL